MKRKPDALVTLIFLFCVGLAVSSFASLKMGSDESPRRVITMQHY